MRNVLMSALVAAAAFTGCRGWESEQPPIHLIHNMDTQEKGKAYRRDTSGLFADGRMMRAPVEGARRRRPCAISSPTRRRSRRCDRASGSSTGRPTARPAPRFAGSAPRWRAWAGITSVSSGTDSSDGLTGISDTASTPPGRRHPIQTEPGPANHHYSLGPPWDRTTKVAMASLVPRRVSAR